MSKKFRSRSVILTIIVVSGITTLILRSQKPARFNEADVTIQEANALVIESVSYEDWAGFIFDYPEELEIETIELSDNTVYSSLELVRNSEDKGILRVADTNFKDLESFINEFEKTNVVVSTRNVLWVDIPALQLTYGAPVKLKTVAIEEGIIYELETVMDEGGFWDETHKMVLNSFEFTQEPEVEAEVIPVEDEEADIILLDEEVIE